MVLLGKIILLRIVLCEKQTGSGFLLNVLMVRGGEVGRGEGKEKGHCIENKI